MIRHILLWKFTDKAKKEGIAKKIQYLRPRFAAMVGKVNGLYRIELCEGLLPSEYDLALYGEFESLEAVAAYQSHPLHLEIKETAKDWVCGRACIDIRAE